MDDEDQIQLKNLQEKIVDFYQHLFGTYALFVQLESHFLKTMGKDETKVSHQKFKELIDLLHDNRHLPWRTNKNEKLGL